MSASAAGDWGTPDGLPLIVHYEPVLHFTEDEFFEFCQLNRDLRIERTADQCLSIMPPTGFTTGGQNTEIVRQLADWTKCDGLGTCVGSSVGFRLPNGAVRSPDASWTRNDRLATVPSDVKERFLPMCPDFVVELRSPSDRLATVQAKMDEYMENGARLGWLIDPSDRGVYIYRPGSAVERLRGPAGVSGEDVLPGFELLLGEVW